MASETSAIEEHRSIQEQADEKKELRIGEEPKPKVEEEAAIVDAPTESEVKTEDCKVNPQTVVDSESVGVKAPASDVSLDNTAEAVKSDNPPAVTPEATVEASEPEKALEVPVVPEPAEPVAGSSDQESNVEKAKEPVQDSEPAVEAVQVVEETPVTSEATDVAPEVVGGKEKEPTSLEEEKEPEVSSVPTVALAEAAITEDKNEDSGDKTVAKTELPKDEQEPLKVHAVEPEEPSPETEESSDSTVVADKIEATELPIGDKKCLIDEHSVVGKVEEETTSAETENTEENKPEEVRSGLEDTQKDDTESKEVNEVAISVAAVTETLVNPEAKGEEDENLKVEETPPKEKEEPAPESTAEITTTTQEEKVEGVPDSSTKASATTEERKVEEVVPDSSTEVSETTEEKKEEVVEPSSATGVTETPEEVKVEEVLPSVVREVETSEDKKDEEALLAPDSGETGIREEKKDEEVIPASDVGVTETAEETKDEQSPPAEAAAELTDAPQENKVVEVAPAPSDVSASNDEKKKEEVEPSVTSEEKKDQDDLPPSSAELTKAPEEKKEEGGAPDFAEVIESFSEGDITSRDLNINLDDKENVKDKVENLASLNEPVEKLDPELDLKTEESKKTEGDTLEEAQQKNDEEEKPESENLVASFKYNGESKAEKQDAVPTKPGKSNNIMSKVKQSIVKVKKAIIGKSPSSKTLTSEAKHLV